MAAGSQILAGGAGSPRRSRWALAVKRAIDVVGAGVAGLALSPVLAATAAALAVAQGRPVLFRQTRPGQHGKPFQIYKFRTMRAPRPGEDPNRSDQQRLTAIGRFLRNTSLDELPELWNVLRGDMSLVGPRPLLMEYLDAYTPDEHRRHDMPVGLTGWAAVNGRHALRFKDRIALDLWYVDHWSLWLDLKIIGMTAWQVIRRKDVVAAQSVADVGFPFQPPPAAAPSSAQGRGEGERS